MHSPLTRFRVLPVVLVVLFASLAASTGAGAQPSGSAGEDGDVSSPVCADEIRTMSAREQLSLEDLDTSQATEVRLGEPVSAADAARLDELDGVRADTDFSKLRRSLSDSLGNGFVSATWSYVEGVQIRVRAGTSRQLIDEAIADSSAPERLVVVEIPGDPLSESARLEIEERMTTPEVLNLFTEVGVFAAEADEFCGGVTLVVDSSRSVDAARERLRETTANVCKGDSGGTVWRSTWYAGIVKGGTSAFPASQNVNNQPCWDNMVYSHVGWIPFGFNVNAPAGFS